MSYSKLWLAMALGACSQEPLETGTARGAVQTTQTQSGGTVTTIKVNGKSVDVILNATDMNGFLNASQDQIANTSSLDFGFAIHDPNPDIQTFVNGAGDIPNSALVINTSTATLNVTTTFPINRCVVNFSTNEVTCTTDSAITFDLAWTADNFQTVFQKLHQVSTQGPVTTTFKGTFDQISAGVSGSFTGFTIADNSGNIIDTKNSTATREVDFEPHP